MPSPMNRKRPAALIACCSKPPLRTVTDAAAAAATTSDSSSWASLHEDLVCLIGWLVLAGDLLDYVRFRAVCPYWRSSTPCPRGRGVVDPRFYPRRWMMLPEGHGLHPGHGKLRGYVRFFNLSSGAFARLRLPLFRDHCVLDSVDGILLLQRDHDTAIRLLHPFTGDIAELPPLATLLKYVNPMLPGADEERGKWMFLRRVLAASISVSPDGVITVMMLLDCMPLVAFATSGDKRWKVSSWWFYTGYSQISFQGRIYIICQPSSEGEVQILQIDPPHQEDPSTLPLSKLIATFPACSSLYYHLVECNSEILFITKRLGHHSHFSVYRLADLILERTVPVTCIGAKTLFIGHRTVCVNSKAFPTVVGDAIVFLKKGGTGLYLAQYHLGSGTLLPASDGFVLGNAMPSPISVIYHIFTCCFRRQWLVFWF
ncbi:hypothetical protein BAE44_0005540 [Dichanthelium oligosanthes]|uniref:KIB1-4 beta-propeller domain-containing protein n=1 Tax=Dichanthelium oligosanthes TaxID=888268 RepID=A0A1E5W7Q7_9POAL|nr:hypothetical protein BAE44_0005540 [Dichanthelium oligosanthes]